MACETFIAWDWNPRDPGNGLHNSSLSLGWGHISQGCSQPIMAQAKKVFLGDIGLWQWMTSLGSEIPRKPCWNLRLQSGRVCFHPTLFTLTFSPGQLCSCPPALPNIPISLLISSHHSFPPKKSFVFNPFLAAVSQRIWTSSFLSPHYSRMKNSVPWWAFLNHRCL